MFRAGLFAELRPTVSVLMLTCGLALTAWQLAPAQDQAQEAAETAVQKLRELVESPVLTGDVQTKAMELVRELGAEGAEELVRIAINSDRKTAFNVVQLLSRLALSEEKDLAKQAEAALEKIADAGVAVSPHARVMLNAARARNAAIAAAQQRPAIPGMRSFSRRVNTRGAELIVETETDWIRVRRDRNGAVSVARIDLSMDPPVVEHAHAANEAELKEKHPRLFEWYEKLKDQLLLPGPVVVAARQIRPAQPDRENRTLLQQLQAEADRLSKEANRLAASPDVNQRDLRILAEELAELARKLKELTAP